MYGWQTAGILWTAGRMIRVFLRAEAVVGRGEFVET